MVCWCRYTRLCISYADLNCVSIDLQTSIFSLSEYLYFQMSSRTSTPDLFLDSSSGSFIGFKSEMADNHDSTNNSAGGNGSGTTSEDANGDNGGPNPGNPVEDGIMANPVLNEQ